MCRLLQLSGIAWLATQNGLQAVVDEDGEQLCCGARLAVVGGCAAEGVAGGPR